MDLKGSRTEANLRAAFASKAHSKNMYDSYAYRCAYSGLQQIQDTMYDAARLEATHARILYEFLHGPVQSTAANIRLMLEDEIRLGQELAACAEVARSEGQEEAVFYFEETVRIHNEHIGIYEQILYNLEHDRVFAKDEKRDWICIACGLVVHDRNAPETCPYCEHPKGLFYLRNTTF